MKISASGGTDAATIVLFWPNNMPPSADDILKDDPTELMESMQKEGKLIWFLCDGDGDYSVTIYLDEPVLEHLLKFCADEERYPNLEVSGDGYFGGAEYMFKNDRSALDFHPHMCEKVVIPNGNYAATVYRTNEPESVYEAWLLERAGRGRKRLWELHGSLAAAAVISVLVVAVSFFFASWRIWSYIVGVAILFCGAAIGLSRTKAYQLVAKANAEYRLAYPAYVVHLD